MNSQNYASTLSIVGKKGTLATFPKQKCNVKYHDTNTTRSITSEDQHKWVIPCRSARRFEKHVDLKTPFQITNKLSPIINNFTPTEHTIRNLNGDNIQEDDLRLINKSSRITENFYDLIIFSISEKQLFSI